jgi:hypothetical protein
MAALPALNNSEASDLFTGLYRARSLENARASVMLPQLTTSVLVHTLQLSTSNQFNFQ